MPGGSRAGRVKVTVPAAASTATVGWTGAPSGTVSDESTISRSTASSVNLKVALSTWRSIVRSPLNEEVPTSGVRVSW